MRLPHAGLCVSEKHHIRQQINTNLKVFAATSGNLLDENIDASQTEAAIHILEHLPLFLRAPWPCMATV